MCNYGTRVLLNTSTITCNCFIKLPHMTLCIATKNGFISTFNIMPIHKSGSINDPSNYRGISLINIMYQIFSGIITERLTNYAEDSGLIDEAQAGFRAGYSVTVKIVLLTKYGSKIPYETRWEILCSLC